MTQAHKEKKMTVKKRTCKKYKKEHKHTIKFTKDGRDIYMIGRNKKEKMNHTLCDITAPIWSKLES